MMTPAERAAALDTLGWSMTRLATALGVTEGTVRGWQSEARRPRPEIDDWLAQLAREIAPHRRAIEHILAELSPPPRPPGGMSRR